MTTNAAKAFEAGAGRSALAGLVALAAKVVLHVPTVTCGGRPVSKLALAYQLEKVAEQLARWFGGYTETAGHGGWFSETQGKVVREPVVLISANADPAQLNRVLPALVTLARQVGLAMKQEAVALEVDGTMYLVPPAAVPVPHGWQTVEA